MTSDALVGAGSRQKTDLLDFLVIPPGLFRFSLALIVLLSHLSAFGVGRLGVALFFMLSGYWISNLWNRVGGWRHAPKFLANRFFRIYPLYLAVVLLCLALFPVHITPSTFLLLGAASSEGPRAIGVEWSLDVELEFYILFPILYFLIDRYKTYSLAIFAVLTAAGWAIVLRWGITNAFQFMPMFYAGMWLYQRRGGFSTRAALASLVIFVLFFFVCAAIPQLKPQVLLGPPELINSDIFGMVWAGLLIPYVGASIGKRSGGIDRALGDSSFPLYLIHYPAIRLTKEFVHGQGIAAKAVALVVIALACAALYFFVDRPMERVRRRVLD